MSGRILLSRPRTRIYDANYNIGENYYKPTLDNLGRRNRRSASPVRSANLLSQRENDLFSANGFEDSHSFENAASSRRAAFHERSAALHEEAERETSDFLDSVRRRRKKPVTFDDEEPSTVSKRLSQTLSITDRRSRAEGSSLRSSAQDSADLVHLTKWTPLPSQEEDDSRAINRRNKLRNKIMDIENEMIDVSQKQATREMRTARVKAMLAESSEETAAAQSIIDSGFRRLEMSD